MTDTSNYFSEEDQRKLGEILEAEFRRAEAEEMTDRELDAFPKLRAARKALARSENMDKLSRASLKAAMTYHSTRDLLPRPFNTQIEPHSMWSSMRPIDAAETLISKNFENEVIKNLDEETLERVIETVSWRLREMDAHGIISTVELKGEEVPFTASEAVIYLNQETSERLLFGSYTFIEYVTMLLESWAPLEEEKETGEVK